LPTAKNELFGLPDGVVAMASGAAGSAIFVLSGVS